MRTIEEINARIKQCEEKYKEISEDDFYNSALITKHHTHYNTNMYLDFPYEGIWSLNNRQVAISIPTDLHGLKPNRYFITKAEGKNYIV